MTQPLSLSSLREKSQPWIDYEIEGFGVFRIGKMNLLDRIELLEAIDEVERDENGRPKNTSDNIKLFVKIVCKSLRGPTGEREFDCQEGFDSIMAMPNGPFMELFNAVTRQIGLSGDDDDNDDSRGKPNPIDSEVEAAKND